MVCVCECPRVRVRKENGLESWSAQCGRSIVITLCVLTCGMQARAERALEWGEKFVDSKSWTKMRKWEGSWQLGAEPAQRDRNCSIQRAE